MCARQKAGTAKPSLLGKLLDEYDAGGTVDAEHEYDLKMVGVIMYGGGSWCTSFSVSKSKLIAFSWS